MRGSAVDSPARAESHTTSQPLHELMRRSSDEPQILARLTGDVMWQRWAVVGGITPEGTPGLAAVALNTVQYLTEPDGAAELGRYMSLVHALDVA